MLGVIVEIIVKLLPIPPCAQVVMASFDDVERAGEAVAAVIGAGILPAGLEMMDSYAIQAVGRFCSRRLSCRTPQRYCSVNWMEQ